ncbi:TolC family protein [Flavobacterium sp. JP2137]|uniref:TolC family protein n=1 Tax=Flavobacterium sp. JP2137 TaxID=3414510 RepID=UPI003D2FC0B2
MNKTKLTITCLLFGMMAQAQELRLTLKEAINYALEHKVDAKKAQLDVENSHYQIQEVRALALPNISVEAGLNNSPLLQQSALPGEFFGQPGETVLVPFGQKWNSTASATLTQTIFNQSVFTGLKAAKTTREFYIINRELTEEQLIEKVAQSYYQIYQSKEMLKTITSNLNSTERIKGIIEGLYNNGLATKIDLDRTKVSLTNIRSKRQQSINAIQLQENSLKFLIGMDLNTAISFPTDTFEIDGTALSNEVNIDQRTELQLLRKQEELLSYKKKSIVAEYYPSLALFGNFAYQGLGEELPWFKKPSDGVNWTNYAMVGLTLKVPIFSGFATRSKVRQAEIDLKKTALDIADTREAMDLSHKNATTQIQNSLITINTQKENVNLAKDVQENIHNNYQNGLATLTDLLDAENAYTEAENNYTNALLDYKLAEIELIKAQGALKSLTK